MPQTLDPFIQTHAHGSVLVSGRFAPAGTGSPTYPDTVHPGWSVTRVSAGLFDISFDDIKYAHLLGHTLALQLNSNDSGLAIQFVSWTAPTATTQGIMRVRTSGQRFFVSTEQTGNGSAQNVAHGLGVVPDKVLVVPTDTSPATTGAYTLTLGAHDATNVVATVTTGKKYMAFAIGSTVEDIAANANNQIHFTALLSRHEKLV
jgi:hypothetical protein